MLGVGRTSRRMLSYLGIPSRPVPHSDSFPPPVFRGFTFSEDEKLNRKGKKLWKWSGSRSIQPTDDPTPDDSTRGPFNQRTIQPTTIGLG
ncbi:unnamed protein product [Clavelina lepadiformis]|uniref:Uncharacterized protein n=1 Tax=Clavelina lepadiformis TaxID=159417 RepID=A0ABP0FQD1_CLALP